MPLRPALPAFPLLVRTLFCVGLLCSFAPFAALAQTSPPPAPTAPINMGATGGTTPYIEAGTLSGGGTPDALLFRVTGTEYMRLTSTGSVGIGTAAPQAKLDINGGLKVGNSNADCTATTAGMIKSTGTALLGCTGTSWYDMMDGTTYSGNDSYTRLLLHFENNATDSSAINNLPTNNGVTFSNTVYKFGSYGAGFNGSSSYLRVPDSANWEFGNGDFTIDFWYRAGATGGYRGIISRQGPGVTWPAWTINDNNSGYLDFAFCKSGSCGSAWETFAGLGTTNLHLGTPEIGVWHHYAVVRSGNTFYGFKDGVLTNTGTNANAIASATGSAMAIGVYNTNYLNGYLDELRVSKGIARWTSNFTPPSAPYN